MKKSKNRLFVFQEKQGEKKRISWILTGWSVSTFRFIRKMSTACILLIHAVICIDWVPCYSNWLRNLWPSKRGDWAVKFETSQGEISVFPWTPSKYESEHSGSEQAKAGTFHVFFGIYRLMTSTQEENANLQGDFNSTENESNTLDSRPVRCFPTVKRSFRQKQSNWRWRWKNFTRLVVAISLFRHWRRMFGYFLMAWFLVCKESQWFQRSRK